MKKSLFFLFLIFCGKGFSQAGTFIIGVKGDTLNKVDSRNWKQGKWVIRTDEIRGEPGDEEEGEYKNNRREGTWRIYSLQGDLTGLEFYRWGNKDGNCQYFNASGADPDGDLGEEHGPEPHLILQRHCSGWRIPRVWALLGGLAGLPTPRVRHGSCPCSDLLRLRDARSPARRGHHII